MLVEHWLTVTATCPVDGKPDVYRVVVRTTRTVKVEDVLAAVARLASEPVYQEAFTQALHRELACEVETRGWHSGVRTVVVCGREP